MLKIICKCGEFVVKGKYSYRKIIFNLNKSQEVLNDI